MNGIVVYFLFIGQQISQLLIVIFLLECQELVGPPSEPTISV